LLVVTIIYLLILLTLVATIQENSIKLLNSFISKVTTCSLTLVCALFCYYVVTDIDSSFKATKSVVPSAVISKQIQPNNTIISNELAESYSSIIKNNSLLTRFGEFILIMSAIVIFLLLGTKYQKE
jgi:hypothetical protein